MLTADSEVRVGGSFNHGLGEAQYSLFLLLLDLLLGEAATTTTPTPITTKTTTATTRTMTPIKIPRTKQTMTTTAATATRTTMRMATTATSVAIWAQAFGFSTLILDRFLSQNFLSPSSIIRPSSLSQFDALLRLRQMGAESRVGAC